jgi:hypothetical protein
MKKNFILSMAIAYTMLAACSNDEIVDVNTGGTISFRTLIDIATRTNYRLFVYFQSNSH